MSNVETVQSIYAAFGAGDVPTILGHLADDVRWEDWEDNSSHRAQVPWMAPRTGRDAVSGFFEIVGQWDMKEFTILGFMDGGDRVAAEVVLEAVLPDTGARLRDEEIHVWKFDDASKVASFRHYTDTAKHIGAATG